MQTLGMLLQIVGSITSIVCFILVIMKMFQNDQSGLAITCIVLLFCCVGGLITYVYGWIKSGQWNLTPVMLIWTLAIALNIVGGVMNPVNFSTAQFNH